ncbi:MAG TPA: hypothetical protein VLG92_03690 [Candidatus Saccharimonadia bacterium]|nr:hypothetical protein [Candidatus Saccharimonadia bacterium]
MSEFITSSEDADAEPYTGPIPAGMWFGEGTDSSDLPDPVADLDAMHWSPTDNDDKPKH